MSDTLYAAQINSPATTLSEAFTSGDNHIHVTELSVFPAATNICTIGTGEDAVTYLYTGKSAASGSGSLTGVSVLEGTAKSWDNATTISRNFTAYDHNAIIDNINELDGTKIALGELGTATYDDLQDWMNVTQSGGRISGGALSAHSPANGTVDVSALKGIIKITNSNIAETKYFDLDAQSAVALTDNSINYIYVEYNSGTPRVLVTTDRTTIRYTDQFNLGRAFRSGNDVEVLTSGVNLYNRSRLTHEKWIDTFGGVSYASGISVTCTGLKPAISAGVMYAGSNKISIDAKDCNGAGTFDSYYYNPTTAQWVITTGQTSLDNTQYNNATTGTGLATLSSTSRYAVHWLYVCPDGDIYIMYGKGDYTLAQAQAATVVTPIPNYLSQWAKLAAKIIIQKSSATVYSITLAWSTQFPVQMPGAHNDLAGLQGGSSDQYYHLTAVQQAALGIDNDARKIAWLGL